MSCSQSVGEHTDVVYGVAWTPDGKRLVSASGDKTLRLWNARTGAMLRLMKDHADSVYGVACSPDGTRILSTGVDRSMKVWDAVTGKPLFTFTGRVHNDTAYTLAFAPDGRHLLSAGGDKIAKMWTLGADADSSREFRRLGNHADAVHAGAFSPDGLLAATASADKTVNLWSGVGGGWLRTLTGANDWLYAVAFSPDSQFVAAGLAKGEPAVVWTRLEVHACEPTDNPDKAFVDFTAHGTEGGQEKILQEKAEFLRINGVWLYNREARLGPAPYQSSAAKIGRNDPCRCGSGKKYKHCCLLKA